MAEMTEEKKAEIRELFDMFDKNKDGHISTSELGTVFRGLGQNPTEKDLKEMVAECDKNGNGTVEINEFCDLMGDKLKDKSTTQEELREAFKVFDRDGNGFVDFKELKAAMKQLGEKMSEEDIKEMIAEADIDSDGKVSYEEFVTMMTA